ncbi:MAG: hypothetical protein E7274_01090 [Pseudobutyrivibrio ruminis]|uniref:hypothetical protein n=1 Tax=Pseudobutyrivibrio ruminis TaxID=46206 RepID=UPI0026ED28E3|nr:hypothetical protein [Pseudobutyrivibrio ruminis]MBE5912639.1 hypothetical protein [Pseudobutyrivibrio ruminis]
MKRNVLGFFAVGCVCLSTILWGTGCSGQTENGTAESETTEEAVSNQSEKSGDAEMKVYSVCHTYGDGEKVSNVILELASQVDASSISTDTFEVVDRTVTDIHVNSECEVTTSDVDGNFIVLDLEIQPAILNDKDATDGRPVNDVPIEASSVIVKQDFSLADGTVISASDTVYETDAGDGGIMGNNAIKTPDLDKFEDNHFYNDPMTGTVLHYNLYKPEGYEESGEEYPLVLFIPDAGAVSSDWERVLTQGNGGTVWTSDEWQAGNPCFVVTMIYEDKYINDYWEFYDGYLYGTISLLETLIDTYPIDTDRVYSTGQSMGCMATMVMMREEPGLIDAGYLLAGQWDPEDIKDIYNENILFLVSEDDPANQKLSADEEKWKEMGAVTADSNISVLNTEEERAQIVDDLVSQDANMYFLRITSGEGSLNGDGTAANGSHRMTWRLGYDLPGVKEWLFAQ